MNRLSSIRDDNYLSSLSKLYLYVWETFVAAQLPKVSLVIKFVNEDLNYFYIDSAGTAAYHVGGTSK